MNGAVSSKTIVWVSWTHELLPLQKQQSTHKELKTSPTHTYNNNIFIFFTFTRCHHWHNFWRYFRNIPGIKTANQITPPQIKSTVSLRSWKFHEKKFIYNTVRVILQTDRETNRVAAWVSGSALVSINKVTLQWAQLVLGWVTVYGWVNASVCDQPPSLLPSAGQKTRSPAIAEGPRDAGVPVEI